MVNISVADLGLKSGATYGDICARACELGLGLCPFETGAQLRLEYKEQPYNEYLHIAMKSILDTNDCPSLFSVVSKNNFLWLDASYGFSIGFWFPNDRFIFSIN
ncbi:MAG: hypothetical protein NTU81_00670 [Candidatus Nomurabacteria bacterium]|nr:hypothetical protein [Candidatus Nomurabacteria bacterium]